MPSPAEAGGQQKAGPLTAGYCKEIASMKPGIYMIGTTHFDPVWMWTWDEGMASIRSTFRAALDRMNENSNFIYSFSCPAVFEWVRRVDPGLFTEIQARVREGRWDLVEGWWVQPDCNLPSGESYVRQGLYGQHYLLRHFGRIATTGFNTDSFGHNAMLPQILSKSGINAYVFGRPAAESCNLPGPLFVWQSPDGSRVIAFRCGSDGANAYPLDVKAAIAGLKERIPAIGHDMLMLYGVSNHGGAPTKRAIADINAARTDECSSFEVRFSSAADFFMRQQGKPLPSYEGELQTDDFGVYVNHTEVKRNNRLAEYALFNAESLCTVAGRDYPRAEITQAWQDTLFNQFHDIIGGASIHTAYDDARNLHGRARQTATEIIHTTLQSITKDIDTNFDGFPLVVYNPNPWQIETDIEAELQWAWEFPWYSGDLTVTDPDGAVIPCQIIQELSALPAFRSRLVFRDTLPPMGYKTYSVTQKSQPMPIGQPMPASAKSIENERYRVTLDDATGCIASIEDKQRNRVVLQDVAMPKIMEDRGDVWAFTTDGYRPAANCFQMLSAKLIESGPVRSVLRTRSRCLDTILEQDFILYQNSNSIEGRFRVHWREKRHALKLYFTTNTRNPTLTAAIPFGALQRQTTGREMPSGEWLTIHGDDGAMSLLNDSIFAYDCNGSTVGLTVLRSPIYAHHGHPDQPCGQIDENKDYHYQEQGCREGRWRVVLHDDDWHSAAIPLLASGFNNPPLVVAEANHPGHLPQRNSLLSIDAQSSMVSAIKHSEDGSGIIIRLLEYGGAPNTVRIVAPRLGLDFSVNLSPHEIKTVLIDRSHNNAVIETDMLERPITA